MRRLSPPAAPKDQGHGAPGETRPRTALTRGHAPLLPGPRSQPNRSREAAGSFHSLRRTPVLARPDSGWYRASRFISRHREYVVAASSLQGRPPETIEVPIDPSELSYALPVSSSPCRRC